MRNRAGGSGVKLAEGASQSHGKRRGRQQRHDASRLGKKWSNSWTLYTSTVTAMMMPSRGLASAVRQGARLNRRFVCFTSARERQLGLTHVRYPHLQGRWLHSTLARQVAFSKDPLSRSLYMLVLPRHQLLLQLLPTLPPQQSLHPHLLPMPSRQPAIPSTSQTPLIMPTCPRDSAS
jgi:hypothetical protein